jgi:hypothetical protein
MQMISRSDGSEAEYIARKAKKKAKPKRKKRRKVQSLLFFAMS